MNSGTTKKISKRPRAKSDDEDNFSPKCFDDDLDNDEDQRLKGKFAEKSNKKFSIALVKYAVSCEWEEHDLARLVFLILKERQLNTKKTLRLLQSCGICTPTVFSTLRDADVEFSCTEIIGHLYDQAQHVDRFIQVIEDSFEQNLLNLTDTATVDAVRYCSFIIFHGNIIISFVSSLTTSFL